MEETSMEKLTEIVVNKLKRIKLSGVYQFTDKDIVKNIFNLSSITLEVTERCNLNCAYCVYGKFYITDLNRNNRNMTIDTIHKLFQFLLPYWKDRPAGSPLTIYFYGGEPLLNINLINNTIKYINTLLSSFNINYSITTNGLLLNKYMDCIVENNFTLLISLDGNKTHNSYRITPNGRESFSRVLKNIEKLREKYPDYFESKVSFNMVLHNRNDAKEASDFIKNKFNKNSKWSSLAEDGLNKCYIDEFRKIQNHKKIPLNIALDSDDNLKLLDSSIGRNLWRLMSYFDMCYNDFSGLLYSSNENKFTSGSCSPFKKLFISVCGDLLPCPNINRKYLYTNVNDFQNINLTDIACSYNELLDKYYRSVCQSCASINICNNCIYTRDWIEADIVDNCRGKTEYNQFVENLDNIIKFLATNPRIYAKMAQIFN